MPLANLKLTSGEHPVIDLNKNYGALYRVKRGERRDQFIGHQWGYFYAHSATKLGCYVKSKNKFGRLSKRFPNICVTQAGDDEFIFIFGPDIFPELASFLKVRRRKQYSPETKEKLQENARKAREAAAQHREAAKAIAKSFKVIGNFLACIAVADTFKGIYQDVSTEEVAGTLLKELEGLVAERNPEHGENFSFNPDSDIPHDLEAAREALVCGST